ncbi:MAG: ParA family protein [Mycoplasmoidaceae bacterium]
MIISVVNNKGGVLKTTISTNLASSISMDKKKVLLIDLDGQGNVSATFGKNPDNIEYTIIDILKNDISVDDVIIFQREPYLHILPSNDEMNAFDFYISTGEIKPSKIQNLIRLLEKKYDYIIIDTPPNMSSLVLNSISMSNIVIIPFEPDQYSVLGLKKVVKMCKAKSEQVNRKIPIVAVATKVNKITSIHKEIINSSIKPFAERNNVYLTNNIISQSTKSSASVGYERVPIVFSSIESKFKIEYLLLKDEIIKFINRGLINEK